MRATGGALRADKSYWYLVHFQWKGDKWQYASIADTPGDLSVRDADGSRVTLERLEPSEARETIGVFLAMDGSQDTQMAELLKKTQEFADCIRAGYVSAVEAKMAVETTIAKTLEYPMEAISLTESQWNKVTWPIRRRALPKMGIVRNYPINLVHSPEKFTGIGWMHPYHLNYIKQMISLPREMPSRSVTGSLMGSVLEQHVLEMGFNPDGGDWNFSTTKVCLTSSWWTYLLEYMEKHEFRMDFPGLGRLQLRSSDDQFLMKAFIEAGYNGAELCKLNVCRMFLKVITVSDIAKGSLDYLEDWTDRSLSATKQWAYQWPRSPPKPPQDWWNLWKKALIKSLCRESSQHVCGVPP